MMKFGDSLIHCGRYVDNVFIFQTLPTGMSVLAVV